MCKCASIHTTQFAVEYQIHAYICIAVLFSDYLQYQIRHYCEPKMMWVQTNRSLILFQRNLGGYSMYVYGMYVRMCRNEVNNNRQTDRQTETHLKILTASIRINNWWFNVICQHFMTKHIMVLKRKKCNWQRRELEAESNIRRKMVRDVWTHKFSYKTLSTSASSYKILKYIYFPISLQTL